MATGLALSIEKITVYPNRLVVLVQCSPNWHYTNAQLARLASQKHPHLAQHACVNEEGPCFSSVMHHTPLPHLFEHIVVDILVQQASQAQDVFVGTSEWLDRTLGRARVEVSFQDDLDALAAVKQAQQSINALCAGFDQPV